MATNPQPTKPRVLRFGVFHLNLATRELRKHRVRVYGTFIFGYDRDTPECFSETVAFENVQM